MSQLKKIKFEDPHRIKHFEHFNSMNYPHFQVTSRVDVTELYKFIKVQNLHFTSAVVYWLCRAAHDVRVLKWRIRDDEIVEHQFLDPSFAIISEKSEAFSFCTVEYTPNWEIFQRRSIDEIERMKEEPSFEDEEGKDNFLFMSCLPWIDFTSIQHPVSMPADSVPRILWGKFVEKPGIIDVAISIQAHHALVDGKDLGQFFQELQGMADSPTAIFS